MVQVGQKAPESALAGILDNEFVDAELSDIKREVVDAYGVLRALQTGEKCPVDRVPGEARLR